MTKKELSKILKDHEEWLIDFNKGKRADLSGANLKGADLKGADLSGANLKGADLEGADLEGADLSGANLRGANLSGADLFRADLEGADLEGADLTRADLYRAYFIGAYLSGANLIKANLIEANLIEANLSGANLTGADLSGAYLSGANLYGTILPDFLIVPEKGSFYGYKKTTKGVIKVKIPAKAKRVNSIGSRKCRAEYVKVISGEGIGGTGPYHDGLIYEKGKIIRADKFDDDIRKECTNGIHFFMTEKEAKEYN